MAALSITTRHEVWPVAGRFTISRGTRTEAHTVAVRISDGRHTGRGECVPYGRYGETVAGVLDVIARAAPAVARGISPAELQELLPPGAARNGVDCALVDLEAKRAGRPAAELLGVAPPAPVTTCFTISLGTPEEMAATARAAVGRPLLKLKLGGAGDIERLRAVRTAVPDARLVADANEAWPEDDLELLLAAATAARLELIEQPLPAGRDGRLAAVARGVPVCADESVHTRADLAGLAGRYQAVNIKLDKAGGLTEALAMATMARSLGLDIMVGCMLATSLSMAPAMLLTPLARWVDLDGPLLLARDRTPSLRYEGARIHPADGALWG